MSVDQPVGGSVPPNTAHAISVSLPTWESNIGYEEGDAKVINAMTTGYPRFFVHKSIQCLADEVITRFGRQGDAAMLFPSPKTASCCRDFLLSKVPEEDKHNVRVVRLVMPPQITPAELNGISSELCAVLYPQKYGSISKQVWQHSGSGISSRRGEFCLKALKDGYLVEESQAQAKSAKADSNVIHKGPKRYQKVESHGPAKQAEPVSLTGEGEFSQFIEERFGRNLDMCLANNAKLAVKRRIAGTLSADAESHQPENARIPGLNEEHIFLYPTGMNSIFNVHQLLLKSRGPMKSICFGFPYIDTLKILEKWGPGVQFYGLCSTEEINDLEKRLESGERYLALFTEFPGNPLLRSPDLERIHALSKKYEFAVVVDESLGNFINVNVLPFADVVVSSLTKIFSGDSNVMGGSAVFNPHGQFYPLFKEVLAREYEDDYWAEDAVFLERNSRDFVCRVERINRSAEILTSLLESSPLVKDVFYPKNSPTRAFYDRCRNHDGGYGGLFSVIFHTPEAAAAFFDNLAVLKGPSLGTNFTLSCPYTILAHYQELDWAKSLNVPSDLVRISVGLEDVDDMKKRITHALEAVEKLGKST
ncbi:cystathionine gamma-synthase [Nannizzia gypsea CBS 118893]|uniref:cystathionine gamma-synthase n=1 Tax=Arthroderma gypseum (strain ATCC MYA-4604 / CBS 118893) TaxID=535722 RepID=E4UXU5_ARTGP|nr:cystathionine gamma-synthase [Nannizzia gypsea CBS 118893]EFR02777.1 cystathionine gamma-synthase [Nannizzia gypsea CBS 118893]